MRGFMLQGVVVSLERKMAIIRHLVVQQTSGLTGTSKSGMYTYQHPGRVLAYANRCVKVPEVRFLGLL
jgi:hypothetical protein